MKIDKSTQPLPASQIGEVAPRSPNAKPSGGTASSDTSVRLGTASAQLRSMKSSLDNTSVVDKEKVATIKQAISEGRFQINSGAIADRLIDSAKELISANKGV
jgi:negative regulator of flagellin synthesis FlgM